MDFRDLFRIIVIEIIIHGHLVIFTDNIDAFVSKHLIHLVNLIGSQIIFFHHIHDFCIGQAPLFLSRLNQLLDMLQRQFLPFFFAQLGRIRFFRTFAAPCRFLCLFFDCLIFILYICHKVLAPFFLRQDQCFISSKICLHAASASTRRGSLLCP